MIRADIVVVGSGLTGSVIARTLHDAGREVVVLERRAEIGGNVRDEVHQPSGIRYHAFGPHYFRTGSDRIWEFATRFGDFMHYEARVLASIDGELVPWPPQRSYIESIAGKDWKPEFTGTPKNLEDAALSMMPRAAYSRFVEGYNLKQWGRHPRELSASLCRRFDVRDGETRLTPNARWQGLPAAGYTKWMEAMLAGIPVVTSFDYLERRQEVQARQLIYTGAIDAYFDYRLGKLEYRSQKRTLTYYPDKKAIYPSAQVNYPQMESGAHIRDVEWRHLLPANPWINGSLVTREVPFSPTDADQFEYPMMDQRNAELYAQYKRLAAAEQNVVFIGRLAKFQYLDMDCAMGAALKCAERMLDGERIMA